MDRKNQPGLVGTLRAARCSMESPYDYAEAFRAAAQAIGGEQELADRLGVRVEDLHAWIQAGEPPPLDAFLGALDLIDLT